MASCSRFTTLFVKFCLLITLPNVAPFSFTATSGTGTALFSSASSAALDLLYQDQQEAMLRRSFHEQELLLSNNNNNEMKELLAPKVKAKPPKSGTGFGGGSANLPQCRRVLALSLESI